jgi:Ca2+-binding RTX toxin-like protein
VGGSGPETLFADDLDLQARRLDVGLGGPHGTVTGFEDAEAQGARVDVVGTGKANPLTVSSCRVGSARGLGGDDTITVRKLTGHAACQESAVRSAYGGPGDDVLIGGPESELLDGGPGHDTADGGPGRDSCVSVEVPTGCERG